MGDWQPQLPMREHLHFPSTSCGVRRLQIKQDIGFFIPYFKKYIFNDKDHSWRINDFSKNS